MHINNFLYYRSIKWNDFPAVSKAICNADEKIKSIDYFVERDIHGEACNCRCADCGETVAARFSSKEKYKTGLGITPHFSHKSGSDCNGMTAIHKLSQQIIFESKKVLLPSLELCGDDCHGVVCSMPYHVPVIQKHKLMAFDSSEIPKSLKNSRLAAEPMNNSNIIPDILLSIGGKTLAVEVAVSSFCDNDKILEFKRIGLPVIEIDLRRVKPDIDEKDLKEILHGRYFKSNSLFRWLWHPMIGEAESRRDNLLAEYEAEKEHQDRLKKIAADKDNMEKKTRRLRSLQKKDTIAAERICYRFGLGFSQENLGERHRKTRIILDEQNRAIKAKQDEKRMIEKSRLKYGIQRH